MPAWRKIERETRDQLGEGTLWSARDNALYWVDILDPAVNRLTLADEVVKRWAMPERIGWLVEREQGGFIAGFQSGFSRLSLEPLAVEHIGDPEPDLPGNRMNDGKADADGTIWCGTMDCDIKVVSGSLYRLTSDGKWTVMDADYGVTNGPAFSPCGSWLYHTDTMKGVIYRFRRTPEGGITDREEFIRFSEGDGLPDGMTTDSDGGLWVAHWGGARVSRFNPDGALDRAVELPAQRITNVAFGGEKLDRMFVTSAADGLPPSEYDGALFEVESGAQGVAPGIYRG